MLGNITDSVIQLDAGLLTVSGIGLAAGPVRIDQHGLVHPDVVPTYRFLQQSYPEMRGVQPRHLKQHHICTLNTLNIILEVFASIKPGNPAQHKENCISSPVYKHHFIDYKNNHECSTHSVIKTCSSLEWIDTRSPPEDLQNCPAS